METYDERLTTRLAERSARAGASAPADALAAAHLLESYLRVAREARPIEPRRLGRSVRRGRGGEGARAAPGRARGPQARARGASEESRERSGTGSRTCSRRESPSPRIGRRRSRPAAEPAAPPEPPPAAAAARRARRATSTGAAGGRAGRARRRGRGDRPARARGRATRRRRRRTHMTTQAAPSRDDHDPRGLRPPPDRRDREAGRAQGRLHEGERERPRASTRRSTAPRARRAWRASCSRRPTTCLAIRPPTTWSCASSTPSSSTSPQVNMSYARSKNLTTYDVLIIASMIEREVAGAEGAQAGRRGDLQPPPRRACRSRSTPRSASRPTTTRSR